MNIKKLPLQIEITRKTASKYLNELESIGFLELVQIKNSKYFINTKLFDILKQSI